MKIIRHFSIPIILLLLQACAAPVKSDLSTDSTQPLPATFLLRGELVIGPKIQKLTPCGSNKQYWVALRREELTQIVDVSSSTYQPMYAELIGHLQPPSANGLDNDFTARFIVDGINLISAENLSGCQQPSQSTRVFGTEPFWGIKFVGHSLQQSQPGMAAELYPITSRQITANKRQYTIEQGQLTLKKQRCDDGMSDSVYGWQATFVRNDHALEGCAVLSGQDATLGWAGQYQAVSSKDAALRISLELQPDHSATLVYSNTRQRSDIRESGFWQQINPQQLQLVITRYQDQQIHVTRLFTLEGNKLTAKEEDVNGKRYSISDGGLVLYRSAL